MGSPPAPALDVAGVAYTNNDADPATATTLFDLDTEGPTDALFIQAPANAGILNATGNLGVDAVGDVGFDIFSPLRGGAAQGAVALAAITTDRSRLYEIDLITGRATHLGRFRRGDAVIGLAIALDARTRDRDPLDAAGLRDARGAPDPRVRSPKGPQEMRPGCVPLLCTDRHWAAQSGTVDGPGTPAAPRVHAGGDAALTTRGQPPEAT